MTPSRFFASLFVTCTLLMATATELAAVTRPVAATEPVITSVRGRHVTVSVPAGFDRIVLQAMRSARRRAAALDDADRWKTVATKYPQREAGVVTFRLARLIPKRQLRVLGNQDDILPGSFFTGFTNFLGDPPIADAAVSNGSPPVTIDGALGSNGLASGGRSSEFTATRDVVESDIWKVVGDRLYFYNQLRGLQLFDLSD